MSSSTTNSPPGGKPLRFGYKVWCVNTVMGYLIDFEIYQGKSVIPDIDVEKNFGKAAAPLVKMIEELPNSIKRIQFSLYFDNLFTSFTLLSFSRLKEYGGTGTMSNNRILKSCPLSDEEDLHKKQRGYFEHSISRTDGTGRAQPLSSNAQRVASGVRYDRKKLQMTKEDIAQRDCAKVQLPPNAENGP
nr:unnamed protein product [Callosobruchus analis]